MSQPDILKIIGAMVSLSAGTILLFYLNKKTSITYDGASASDIKLFVTGLFGISLGLTLFYEVLS